MPIYEYRCSECGYEFEKLQKFSDAPVSICPECQGSVRKLISQSTFHLKGSGWYVTDYAKKSTSDGNGKANKAKASESSSGSSKEGSSKDSSSGSSGESSSSRSTSTSAASSSSGSSAS